MMDIISSQNNHEKDNIQDFSKDPVYENSLSINDVIIMMPPVPPSLDPLTAETVLKFRTSIMKRRVLKVNKLFFDLKSIWPNGSPLEYYIALELCNDDPQELAEKISHKEFFQTVRYELDARLYSSEKSKYNNIHCSEDTYEAEKDDGDFQISKDLKKSKKHKNVWLQTDIESFKQLYLKKGPFKNWKNVAKYFPTKTPNQCKCLYNELRSKNELPVKTKSMQQTTLDFQKDSTPNNHQPNKKSISISKIQSIVFVYDDKRSVVGPRSRLFEMMTALNPIPGYIDQITMQPMTMPALSPDGYILDYTTWLKLLNEKKVNPFTQNHMKSKRELTILTVDNFDHYRSKIVNLEECIP